MSFPKIKGGFGTSTQIGLGQFKELHRGGSPFLTKTYPGGSASIKGEFSEVATDPQDRKTKPYLWSITNVAGAPTVVITGKHARGRQLPVIPLTTGATSLWEYGLGVGDRRIMAMFKNAAATAAWPVLEYQTSAVEVAAGAPGSAASAISFAGESVAYEPTGMFAPGWAGAIRYTWGYSYTNFNAAFGASLSISDTGLGHNTTVVDSRPFVVLGTTSFGPTSTVQLPCSVGRLNFGSSVFCNGPGKLAAVVVTGTKVVAGAYQAAVDPILVTSDDFGATWAAHACPLAPYLTFTNIPAFGDRYDNEQLWYIAQYVLGEYIGGGISIMVVGNLVDDPAQTTYRTRSFKYCFKIEGTTMTRVTWPFDAEPRLGSSTLGRGVRLAPGGEGGCFGRGCFLHIGTIGGSYSIISTRDFGVTWTVVPFPAAVLGALFTGGYAPTVLRPYESPAQPGKILFTAPATAGLASNIWQTDGTFATFTLIGTTHPVGTTGPRGQVAYANPGTRLLRPDLPTEFTV